MKKNIFVLILLLNFLFVVPASAAEKTELYGDSGYDGYVTVYMYVTPESNKATNVVTFLDMETLDEYYVLFNPMNYEFDDLWYEVVNIPTGEYLITGGRYLDTKAKYYLETNPTKIQVEKGKKQSFVCTVASSDWFGSNSPATMNDVDAIRKQQVAEKLGQSLEATKALSPTEVPEITESIPTQLPTPSEKIEIPALPEPEKPKLRKYIIGVVAIGLFIFFFCRPKKYKKD